MFLIQHLHRSKNQKHKNNTSIIQHALVQLENMTLNPNAMMCTLVKENDNDHTPLYTELISSSSRITSNDRNHYQEEQMTSKGCSKDITSKNNMKHLLSNYHSVLGSNDQENSGNKSDNANEEECAKDNDQNENSSTKLDTPQSSILPFDNSKIPIETLNRIQKTKKLKMKRVCVCYVLLSPLVRAL